MEMPDQEKSCVDCSDKELVKDRDTEVAERDAAPENQENCGMDDCSRDAAAAPGEAVCDGESDTVPSGVDEHSAGEGAIPDQSGEKCQKFCRHPLHDLKNYAISEVTSTAVELASHTVVPPAVVEYYKQFGLDERIIKIMFQLRPPDVPPGIQPGIGISG